MNPEPDEADEPDEAETVAATAAQSPLPHAPGVRMTVVNKLPQIIYSLFINDVLYLIHLFEGVC